MHPHLTLIIYIHTVLLTINNSSPAIVSAVIIYAGPFAVPPAARPPFLAVVPLLSPHINTPHHPLLQP